MRVVCSQRDGDMGLQRVLGCHPHLREPPTLLPRAHPVEVLTGQARPVLTCPMPEVNRGMERGESKCLSVPW